MVERKRHLAKAVTYRIMGSFGTAVIAMAATGDARIGVSIGVLDSVLKIGFYYAHERLWYRIRWGIRPDGQGHNESQATPRDPTGRRPHEAGAALER
ncbi:MAG: DUF2061 domain-containing protein [Phycisphaerales bacterium]|nr:DUF2061 domain-containing protein [Phycisphaerales bacterium]